MPPAEDERSGPSRRGRGRSKDADGGLARVYGSDDQAALVELPAVRRSTPLARRGSGVGGSTEDVLIGSPMPNTVIASAEQATPEWLTGALSTSGALSAGKVIAVERHNGDGNWSTNARLRPRYSADAAGERPTSLFLKMVRTDLDDDESFSDSEVRYYTRDYVDVPDAPLVRCHDAAHSTADQAYHLLLDEDHRHPCRGDRPSTHRGVCARSGRRSRCDARPLVGRQQTVHG